ncbi:MAG TPA: SpoIIE family protein phosphatase [Thermoanaerobaculia bacterium]|nr:SpoIIE family protein phosphatase [Thermoanaerobaculia bacterium]
MNRRALLLAIFVIAAACGYALEFFWVQHSDPLGANLGLEISRGDAITAARQFATTYDGISRAQAYVKFDGNDDLERFFSAAGVTRQARAVVEERSPAVSYLVLLMDREGKNRLRVRVSRSGRVLGYSQLDVQGEQRTYEASALAAAQGALLKRFGKESAIFRYDGSKPVERQNRRDLAFKWSRQASPHLAIDANVEVAGTGVISEEIKARIDPTFQEQHIKSIGKANTFLGILIWCMALIIAIYALFRYVVRVREQEVPHGRALLLLLVVLVASASGLLIFSDDSVFDVLQKPQETSQGTFAASLPVLIALFFFALAIAIAWAGCEGDLRERFPGKLTSFDALLGGRIGSSNVATAFLTAAGWAGVSFLLFRMVGLGMANSAASTSFKEATVMASRIPMLASLFSYSLMSAITAVLMGMMVPVSMLRRWKTTGARLGFVIFLILFVVFSATLTRSVPGAAAFALAAVGAAMLAVPFMLHDLLTSLLSTVIGSTYLFGTRMLSQPDQDLRTQGIALLAVLLIALVAALTRAFRTPLPDSEVRPLYARNLLERQSLEAELSAARHAQQRLLPMKLPEIPGASVTARCEPSSDVSGDYYDVLSLSDGRLLFVMVDESVEGLSAALRVTLIKGLLLSYARRLLPAAELVRRVKRQVQDILNDQRQLYIAVALFDPVTRHVELARSGDSPSIFISMAPSPSDQSEQSAAITREVIMPASTDVQEVELTLERGEALMMLSDAFDDLSVSQMALGGSVQHIEALFRPRGNVAAHASGDRTALVLATERG